MAWKVWKNGIGQATWLRIEKVIIRLDSLRGRCIITTFDPDTLEHDFLVLRDIVKRFEGELALNSEVEQGGEICVGQQVELLNTKHA